LDAATCSHAVRLIPCCCGGIDPREELRIKAHVDHGLARFVVLRRRRFRGWDLSAAPAMKSAALLSSPGFTMCGILIVIAFGGPVKRLVHTQPKA
jgi:hypothetical protein